jgi:hypothetical protein
MLVTPNPTTVTATIDDLYDPQYRSGGWIFIGISG